MSLLPKHRIQASDSRVPATHGLYPFEMGNTLEKRLDVPVMYSVIRDATVEELEKYPHRQDNVS